MQASAWSPPTGTLGMLVESARRRAVVLADREGSLTRAVRDGPRPAGFRAALDRGTVAVIAEIKRRSPSKGAINSTLDAIAQASAYQRGGAAAISVLSEPDHFGGSSLDVEDVRRAVTVPVLKKDFHVHPIQLLEAKALGASAALLIARALAPGELVDLAREARMLDLEVLVEIRDEWELERALAIDATVIGVNNRDLETLRIDPRTAERLLPAIPSDVIAVAESGMRSIGDILDAASWGADAVLIGSFLSASADPQAAVRALCEIPRRRRDG